MKKFSPVAKAILFLVIAAAVVVVLHHVLREYRYGEVLHALSLIPRRRLALALILSLLGYFVMTGYDTLAFYYIRKPMPYGRVALASFIGYAFNNNIGLSGVIGGSLRYRLYTAWRLSGVDVAKIIAFCTVTFWVGYALLGGLAFLFEPPVLPAAMHLAPLTLRVIGALLLSAVAAYLISGTVFHRPLRIREWELSFPTFPILVTQIVLSSLDWLIASAVLWVVLPPIPGVTFVHLTALFLVGQLAGVLSTLPGGVGVFEAVILLFLSPFAKAPALVASLVAYRFAYYLVPLVVATLLLAAHEAIEQREGVVRVARIFGRWAPGIVPQVLTFTTFLSGAILLFSGATPTMGVRLAWLRDLVPLPLVELSHFLASVSGAALLLLARGLQRRLDAAYVLTVGLLTAGIFLSLVKGLDYEEAIVLSITLVAFLPSRRHFHRKASLLSEPFTPGWIAAIAIVAGCSIWVGFFSYKHVEYSTDLWWHFSFRGDAPRFLRASVGAAVVLLFFAFERLLRPSSPEPDLPTREEIARAAAVVESATSTSANLALLGDKSLLFSSTGNAFLMYAIEGRSWIAMGDPVGPAREKEELVWKFRELSDRHGGWCVFYEVSRNDLPLYVDLGLTLVKLGEEARVPLVEFSLDGGSRKWLRKTQRRVESEGCTFEWIPREETMRVMPELRAVSESWLESKKTREKSFSLGSFNEDYLEQFPVALVRRNGVAVAFANIWSAGVKEEISVDLMRHTPEAPGGVMDYLFLQIMLEGKEEGYRWFNLGIAPLSGLENRTLGPLWQRIGAVAYRHGEDFYNFQGLRQYKEKFDPVWEPVYLAAPGGLSLPIILTNLAALISGGLRGVFAK